MRWTPQYGSLHEPRPGLYSRTFKEADSHGDDGWLPHTMSALSSPRSQPMAPDYRLTVLHLGVLLEFLGSQWISSVELLASPTILHCPQEGLLSVQPFFEIHVMEPKVFLNTGDGAQDRAHSTGRPVGVPSSQIPDPGHTLPAPPPVSHILQFSDTHPAGLAGLFRGNFHLGEWKG